jgi:hypothetical protein
MLLDSLTIAIIYKNKANKKILVTNVTETVLKNSQMVTDVTG